MHPRARRSTVVRPCNRQTFVHRNHLLISLITLLLASANVGARDFDDVQISAAEVTPGLWMLQGAGGNMGLLVGARRALLVDDQYAPLAPRISAAIAKITDHPLELLVNTHWHGDHTGGNEWFGGTGAVIVAQEAVRGRLVGSNAPAAALPAVTFTDPIALHVGGEEVRITPVPRAHTDGDAFVLFRSANVMHTGDLFFNGMYPYIDAGSMGSLQGVIDAQAAMIEAADSDTQIIPGHGPLATRADLVSTRARLIQVRDALQPLVEAGMDVETIVARDPLAQLDLGWDGVSFMDRARFTGVAAAAMAHQGIDP